MKRFVFIISLVLMVALCLNEAQTASAAMRNLLTEFQNALKAKDLEKANSLLKEGLNVQDAFDATEAAIDNYMNLGSFNETEEDCYISLITSTFKGKFKGKYISSGLNCSDKFLKVLLDAGMNPTYLRLELCNDLSRRHTHIDKNDKNLKKLQIILKRGDSDLNKDLRPFINDKALPVFFISSYALSEPENLTQENLDSISVIFSILNYSAEGVDRAKSYLDGLRDQYRNVPDALKYLDKVQEALSNPQGSSGFTAVLDKEIPCGGKLWYWLLGVLILIVLVNN